MNCPRCQLSMRQDVYEGQQVLSCGTCWGYWVTKDALRQILRSESYHFDKKERQSVFETWIKRGDTNRQGQEGEPIDCPVCATRMHRRKLANDCPVLLDQCDKHGIWLDTGEIKELQIFIETRRP